MQSVPFSVWRQGLAEKGGTPDDVRAVVDAASKRLG